jgi:hypothetical protein
MKSMNKVVIPLVAVAVVFGLLRIYGAYQNEKKTALFMAAQASEAAKAAELEVAEDHAHGACAKAWLDYDLEESKADNIRITVGPLAYAKEEARIIADKPVCSKPDTSLGGILQDVGPSLDHISEEYNYWYFAALENRYASDRKLQTRHLLHQAWGKLIGAAPESPEEWGKFLAQNYPDIKPREWNGPAADKH